MDIELSFDFKEFLKLLNDKHIRYLLIGGYAVGYHASQDKLVDREPYQRLSFDAKI